jgi:UDP-glucose 4-epimerase
VRAAAATTSLRAPAIWPSSKRRDASSSASATVTSARALARSPSVVNVGSDQEVSIRSLAERIRTRSGSGSSLTFIPYEQAYGPGFEDMDRRVPDLKRLESLTGFRPRLSLDKIIDDVILAERPASMHQGSQQGS